MLLFLQDTSELISRVFVCVDLTESALFSVRTPFALLKELVVTLAFHADSATLQGVLDQ